MTQVSASAPALAPLIHLVQDIFEEVQNMIGEITEQSFTRTWQYFENPKFELIGRDKTHCL